jgi:hypothetical protein
LPAGHSRGARRDLVITYGNDSIGAPLQQYERMAIP